MKVPGQDVVWDPAEPMMLSQRSAMIDKRVRREWAWAGAAAREWAPVEDLVPVEVPGGAPGAARGAAEDRAEAEAGASGAADGTPGKARRVV